MHHACQGEFCMCFHCISPVKDNLNTIESEARRNCNLQYNICLTVKTENYQWAWIWRMGGWEGLPILPPPNFRHFSRRSQSPPRLSPPFSLLLSNMQGDLSVFLLPNKLQSPCPFLKIHHSPCSLLIFLHSLCWSDLISPGRASVMIAYTVTPQQTFMDLQRACGQPFGTGWNHTFSTTADPFQYDSGAVCKQNTNNNNSLWVRSLYRIIKELDLEQFLYWFKFNNYNIMS